MKSGGKLPASSMVAVVVEVVVMVVTIFLMHLQVSASHPEEEVGVDLHLIYTRFTPPRPSMRRR